MEAEALAEPVDRHGAFCGHQERSGGRTTSEEIECRGWRGEEEEDGENDEDGCYGGLMCIDDVCAQDVVAWFVYDE